MLFQPFVKMSLSVRCRSPKLNTMKLLMTFGALLLAVMASAQQFTHAEVTLPVEDKSTPAVITIPTGDGPFPAVVIIVGSGPTDLDGNSRGLPGKNNSLKMLAEGLAEQGYASIRYNKRIFAGFGEQDLHFEDLVTDAITAYDLLDKDPRFSQVGFAGHSQGSLVGMLAAQQREADFYISLAGIGLDFAEVISGQLKSNPANPTSLIEEAEKIMEVLKKGEQVDEVSPLLAPLFRPSVQPFLGSWMKYDPQEEIAKLSMPVLIVNGTTDIQVGAENADMLLKAVKAKKVKLIIEGMNHVLKEAPADRAANIATYSKEDLPLSIGLIEGIDAFLKSILDP